jgi:hypothetical protein
MLNVGTVTSGNCGYVEISRTSDTSWEFAVEVFRKNPDSSVGGFVVSDIRKGKIVKLGTDQFESRKLYGKKEVKVFQGDGRWINENETFLQALTFSLGKFGCISPSSNWR